LGDAAGNSVSLNFGIPAADSVHISTLLAVRGRGCSIPAAPLLQCTKEEQRPVIRFLWSGGVKMTDIYRKMLLHYGNNYLAQRKVYGWVELFGHGRSIVVDEERQGRPRVWKGQ
jgi:hypothetical protein